MIEKKCNVIRNVLNPRYFLSKAESVIQTREQLEELDGLLLGTPTEEDATPIPTIRVKALLDSFRFITNFWYEKDGKYAIYIDTLTAKVLPKISTRERNKLNEVYKEIFGEEYDKASDYMLNFVIPNTTANVIKDVIIELANNNTEDVTDFLVNIEINQLGSLLVTTIPLREYREVYALQPTFSEERFEETKEKLGDVLTYVDDRDPAFWI